MEHLIDSLPFPSQIPYTQNIISTLVSKSMSGRPMYIVLVSYTLAMLFRIIQRDNQAQEKVFFFACVST